MSEKEIAITTCILIILIGLTIFLADRYFEDKCTAEKDYVTLDKVSRVMSSTFQII